MSMQQVKRGAEQHHRLPYCRFIPVAESLMRTKAQASAA